MSVCRRCGRKLTSEASAKRGYGNYCFKRHTLEMLKEANEEVEDINFVDEIKSKVS